MLKIYICLFILTLCSCTVTYKTSSLEKLKKEPTQKDSQHIRQQKLCFLAYELSKKELIEYFARNIENDYTTIFFSIENLSPQTLSLDLNSLTAVDEKGQFFSPSPIEEVILDSEYSHCRSIPLYLFFLPGAFFVSDLHSSIDESNKLLGRDYQEKAFSSLVLEGKKDYSGILFFPKTSPERLDHVEWKNEAGEKVIIPIFDY